MGPVSIYRLSFGDEPAAAEAARLLRSNGIRVEALQRDSGSSDADGSRVVVLIRAGDKNRAIALLDGHSS